MLFSDWQGVSRIITIALLAYAALIMMLRISGKRTLSKMNAFDFVVTVALGSTLSTMILSKDTPLTEGVVALAMLISMQMVVTWTSSRFPVVARAVKNEPTLMVYEGRLLQEAIKAERITEQEIYQAIRMEGCSDLSQVRALVLETDGSFSVLKEIAGSASALRKLKNNADVGAS